MRGSDHAPVGDEPAVLDEVQRDRRRLGLDVAIQAVETRAQTDLAELVRPSGFGASVLPAVMDPFIRLERRAVSGRTEVDPGFAVLVVTDGQLTIQDTVLHWGTFAVAPYAAGRLELSGVGDVLFARPLSP